MQKNTGSVRFPAARWLSSNRSEIHLCSRSGSKRKTIPTAADFAGFSLEAGVAMGALTKTPNSPYRKRVVPNTSSQSPSECVEKVKPVSKRADKSADRPGDNDPNHGLSNQGCRTSSVTNKKQNGASVLAFHNGRGYQEKLIVEGKQHAGLELIPCRRLVANQLVMCASVLTHNLGREQQIQAKARARSTTPGRRPLWDFEALGSLRHRIIQRAGRFTSPQGNLTLTMNANGALQDELLGYLAALDQAA